MPTLQVPRHAGVEAEGLLGGGHHWIGLIPGAARGPSKRWPAEHFSEAGRKLAALPGVRMAVIGAPGEERLCHSVAAEIGDKAVSLAGHLDFPAWAGVLQRCRAVVANDSGGMHLAAALGTPVVALFGHTDPGRTAPLGTARVLQHATTRTRDIVRDSESARLSLASIQPVEVYDAVRQLAGFT